MRRDHYRGYPNGMREYLSHYGHHFSKRLCEYAVSKMKKEEGGKLKRIEPYTKEQVENLLEKYDVDLKNNKGYDACYVANMCKADYLGSSVPDEKHVALFIKDYLDDPDLKSDSRALDEYYAKCVREGIPIEWEDYI